MAGEKIPPKPRPEKAEDPEHEAAVKEQLKAIGRPPRRNPLRLVQWGQELVAVVAWDWANSPTVTPAARRRGICESVKAMGMVAVKAIDKAKIEAIGKAVKGTKRSANVEPVEDGDGGDSAQGS